MAKIVIALGGSVLTSDLSPDHVKKYADLIVKVRKNHDLKIVVGGGKIARQYVTIARELKAEEDICDLLGIDSTRINARLLLIAVGASKLEPVKTINEAIKQKGLVVMGGTVPGHTTDTVSASLAEKWGADLLIIGTNVDAVYSEDPRINPKAKRFDSMSPNELIKLVGSAKHTAAPAAVIDPAAARIIKKSNIKTIVVDGRDTSNILKAADGKKVGTIIPS